MITEIKGSDQFMSSPDVLEDAREVMGSIDLDPASHWIANEYVRAKTFFGTTKVGTNQERFKDGLVQDWNFAYYNVWLNPPYSRGLIDQFVDKALHEWNIDIDFSIENMMLLVNSQTDTRWYQRLLSECSAACLHKGRIKFWKMFGGKAHRKWEGEKSIKEGKGKIGNSPRFLNTIFYFTRGDIDTFTDVFGKRGTIIKVHKPAVFDMRDLGVISEMYAREV